jgi:hypothetical protein
MDVLLFALAKIFLLAWFIVNFTPIHGIFNLLIKKSAAYPFINFVLSLLNTILICQKCTALWVGLILTGDLLTALTASFISYLYEKFISRYI